MVWRLAPALLLGGLAGGVGSVHLGVAGAWRDEAATRAAATRSLADLWRLVQTVDIVHALYYAMVHGWIALAGDSYLALRALSVLGVAVATALVLLLGSHLAGLVPGTIAALVFLILPPVTWAAGEARSYAWVTAASVATAWALAVALRRNTWPRWLVFGVLAVLLCHLFLFAGLALLAVLPAAALRGDRRFVRALVTLVGAGLLCLPLASMAVHQSRQVNWLPPFSRDLVMTAVFGSWWGSRSWVWAAGGLVLAVGLVSLAARCRHRRGRWSFALLVGWLVLPTLVLLVLTAAGTPGY